MAKKCLDNYVKNTPNIIIRELLALVNKNMDLLFVPIAINLFSNNHDISQFANLLNSATRNSEFRNFKDIIGSSANAIIALLFGLGYNAKEIQHKFNDAAFYQALSNVGNKDYKPLSIVIDTKTSIVKTDPIKKQFKLLSTSDSFIVWIQERIADKLEQPLATFANLREKAQANNSFKDIHLIGLNIETGRLEIFNHKNTPDMPLAIAARICMSCSTAFSVVEIIDSDTCKKCVYADGGIVLQHLNFRTKTGSLLQSQNLMFGGIN